jgi:hypothetical protein
MKNNKIIIQESGYLIGIAMGHGPGFEYQQKQVFFSSPQYGNVAKSEGRSGLGLLQDITRHSPRSTDKNNENTLVGIAGAPRSIFEHP